MDFKTLCVHGRPAEELPGRPLNTPIVMSATFEYDTLEALDEHYETGRGFLYSRYANPTVRNVEQRLAELEGAEDALLFASGMATLSTVLLTVGAGGRIAAQRELYGGTAHLLRDVTPSLGIETVWLSRSELDAPSAEQLAGCRLLLVETPVNPTLGLVDLARVSEVARGAGVPVVVDGTFATPALQQPLSLGCDLVVHSCTKYLGGHSDLTGGAVAGSAEMIGRIEARRRILGGTMDPMTAFLLARGLRTLAIRMEAHERGAGEVARALAAHERVRRVYWPGLPDSPDHELARRQMRGFGGMVTFEVDGGLEAARRVHDRLRLFRRAPSLGGCESLVSLPVKTSHRYLDAAGRAEVGVSESMLRLSVGLEAPADLVEDLDQALR
jgi:cystathionine beta-lyase/cystathionine gamma-synthase